MKSQSGKPQVTGKPEREPRARAGNVAGRNVVAVPTVFNR